MSSVKHIGFGSTPNFSNLYKEVSKHYTSASLSESERSYLETLEGTEISDFFETRKATILPTLTFTGSEKLHGENMAVCYHNDVMWVQGRNNIRTMLADQNGMAQFVEARKTEFQLMFNRLADFHSINTSTHTIILDGEWAGGSIQKGNAACSGTDKGFYLFDFVRIVDEDDITTHVKTGSINMVTDLKDRNIYTLSDFGTYSLTLDFNNTAKCEEDLKALALSIEENSPIAKYFNKPDNVGEGAYLWCIATAEHPTFRLKTKGDKHGGKPKVKREHSGPTSEEQEALTTLADQLTPVWRIAQGITETNATKMKDIGNILKWVNQDILKEEAPVITSSPFEFKQLQGYVSKIVKQYFIDSIKGY